ncbi:COP1-interacting protein 7 [Aegilops tauschii subsp. strangulata]|uniref:COP1-interacting protein 7 n=2 Tax=Aegilops tauschii subsp. strangulata TaxID=200361 RepID=A0A453MMJ7_AEGTS|nr:COP1-interacting protein 7 isoform X1 [Aegilops tauschii subsp. strangulata]
MRPETRLDSAAFQLTPTRTRCDLIVIANGRKEKIASGLLNPFVAHLKAAQDQIAKGGYTILLEPDPGADAPWFTRGTVERFVRFVSTPEVLERVTTIESEILQLEDAIAVQSNENLGLKSGEGHNGKPVDSSMEGGKTGYNTDGDKALVLYKPDAHPASPLQNDDGVHEEHSKVQLLRVLETRKTVLRKEQAMAFARAVAAGFDIDNLIYLISFAERFGASRLMKACTQFIDLWRQKHETGQWIDVEPETMSARSEFPPFNASGIMFMGDKETMSVSNGDTNGEDAAKADHRAPHHPHEYHHGPYQSGYPPWAMHPPYPMQGMPPYYPGANPYYPPPYPPTDDPRYNHSERRPSRKHSADSKDFDNSDEESDDQSGSERESSHGRKSSKKGKRSGKKNVIVIRNVNVTSKKKHRSSESESHSGSDVSSEDSDDSHRKSSKRNHHKRSSSKKKGGKKTIESEDEYTKDGMSNGQQDGDQGNWNAFQNFLLRDEEKTRDNNDADMFASEREPPPPPRRRETTGNMDDPILLSERGSADVDERNGIPFNTANGRIRARQMMSGDELMMSGEGRSFVDGDMKEIEAGGGGYRRGANDDFMVYGHDNSMDRGSSLDPLAEGHYKRPTLEEKKNVHGVDESFMIPVSSTSHDNLGADGRTAIDIDAELGTSVQKTSDAKAGGELFYEPDELMPERGVEDVSFGYDPSMDYDSHMQIHPDVGVEDANAEDLSACVEDEGKMPAKDKKLRGSHEGLDKRRKDASARRLSAPKGPLTDAQKRAQNLRAYKAGLQKEKKELEAEQIKRLERLKQERQKRIAARSGASNPISTPPQAKAKPSPKVSPSTHKSSKFTDAEPGSSSPLRKIIPARSSTPGSDPHKTAKASKLGGDSSSAVSKSTSSLAEIKKEKSGRTESSIERLKKLAEPKSNASTDHPPNPKSVSSDYPRRRSLPEDVQTKKISAIMQLDETKSAALPELKVKSPRTPAAVVVKNKAAAKVTKEAPRGGPKAHATSESRDGKKSSNGKVSRVSSSDDNVVVEKTVVMLENEVVSTPPVVLPSGRSAESETRSDDRMENPSLEQEYIAIRAPPSPIDLPEDANPTIHTSDNQLNSYEVDVPEYKKDELEKPAPLALMEEKPYEAPFARVTSLEDASSKTTAYNHHPLPAQEPETLARAASVRARVPEPAAYAVSAEETHGGSDKPRSKEPKGLRKLLKFGKKSHTSTMDSDASSVDEAPAGDGSMLKNLISQDDSAGSSYKASRSFSLLAPFRKNKVVVL